MKVQTSLLFLGLAALMAVSGCKEQATSPRSETTRGDHLETGAGAVNSPAETTEAASVPVDLQTIDEEKYAAFLQQHRGNVVLIDFWALWCPSCLEGFPQTVSLHQQYHDQGLTVASIAFDDESARKEVLAFLESQQAPFAHFISRYGADPESMEAFQITRGTLPTLKLYDRSGQLRYTFGNGEAVDHQAVADAVRALLQESADSKAA